MTVKEAVLQIRREAGRLGRARRVLEQVQVAIEAPSPDEVARMAEGERPVSAEAHLIGALQRARIDLEDLEEGLRYAVLKETRLRLDEDCNRGIRPSETELRRIRAGLEARGA